MGSPDLPKSGMTGYVDTVHAEAVSPKQSSSSSELGPKSVPQGLSFFLNAFAIERAGIRYVRKVRLRTLTSAR